MYDFFQTCPRCSLGHQQHTNLLNNLIIHSAYLSASFRLLLPTSMVFYLLCIVPSALFRHSATFRNLAKGECKNDLTNTATEKNNRSVVIHFSRLKPKNTTDSKWQSRHTEKMTNISESHDRGSGVETIKNIISIVAPLAAMLHLELVWSFRQTFTSNR